MATLRIRWATMLPVSLVAAIAMAGPPAKSSPVLDAVLRVGGCAPTDRIITDDSTLELPAPKCTRAPCAPAVFVQLEKGVATRCTAPGKCLTGTATVTFDPAPESAPSDGLGPKNGEVRSGEVSLTFGKAAATRHRFRAVVVTPVCG
ncbi:MAG: hypothetical protein Q8L14_13820 [Myxococcales bacterium]|nr:hypothetical protein [Myxococcales bacterium]